MSWWLWIAYSALCAGILLYPSRFNLLIAQQSQARGLSFGLSAAFGAAIGLGLSMTLASIILITYRLYIGNIGDFFGWFGVSWLILTALWTIGTVPYRLAEAQNDNFASKGHLAAFANTLAQHLLGARFLGFFTALLLQFNIAPNGLTIHDFIHLQIATVLLSFLCLAVTAFNPNITITWLRKLGRKIASRRQSSKTLIAGKSVKARYRKIAA